MDPEFKKFALAAGFSSKQAEFMWEYLALEGHTHTAEEVYVDDAEERTLADKLGDEEEDDDEPGNES